MGKFKEALFGKITEKQALYLAVLYIGVGICFFALALITVVSLPSEILPFLFAWNMITLSLVAAFGFCLIGLVFVVVKKVCKLERELTKKISELT